VGSSGWGVKTRYGVLGLQVRGVPNYFGGGLVFSPPSYSANNGRSSLDSGDGEFTAPEFGRVAGGSPGSDHHRRHSIKD
jgi:hypothetical protein